MISYPNKNKPSILKNQSNQIKVKQKEKLQNETHLRPFSLDEYFGPFLLSIQIQNEKIVLTTLEVIKKFIQMNAYKGDLPDSFTGQFYDGIPFLPDKRKDELNRNSLSILIDTMLYPIEKKIFDKKEKIINMIFKCLWTIISNRFLELKIQTIVEILGVLNDLSDELKIRHQEIIQCYFIRTFDLIQQRVQLFTSIKYDSTASNLYINSENQLQLRSQVSKVLTQLVDNAILSKENILIKIENIDYKYMINFEPTVRNEQGIFNGYFGWCVECRNTANYFCRKTKFPICSIECKFKIIQSAKKLEIEKQEDLQIANQDQNFIDNYVEAFDVLIKLGLSLTKPNPIYIQALIKVIQTPSLVLRKDPKAILFMKNRLFPYILHQMPGNIQSIRNYLTIFGNLFANHKKYFQNEFLQYMVRLVYKIIGDVESSYQYKYDCLTFLYQLFSQDYIIIEIFYNYDMNKESFNLCEKFFEILYEIYKGKYRDSSYGLVESMITNLENLNMKILIQILKHSQFLVEMLLRNNDKLKEDFTPREKAIRNFALGKPNSLQELLDTTSEKKDSQQLLSYLSNDKRFTPYILGEIFGQNDSIIQETFYQFIKSLGIDQKNHLIFLRKFIQSVQLPNNNSKLKVILKCLAKYYAENNNIYEKGLWYIFQLIIIIDKSERGLIKKRLTYDDIAWYNQKIVDRDGKSVLKDSELIKIYYSLQSVSLINSNSNLINEDLDESIKNFQDKQERFYNISETEYFKSQNEQASELLKQPCLKFNFDIQSINVYFKTFWKFFSNLMKNQFKKNNQEENTVSFIDSIISFIQIGNQFKMEIQKQEFIQILFENTKINLLSRYQLNNKNIQFIQAIIILPQILKMEIGETWGSVIEMYLIISYHIKSFELQESFEPTNIIQKNIVLLSQVFKKSLMQDLLNDSKKFQIDQALYFLKGLLSNCLNEFINQGEQIQYYFDQLENFIEINQDRNFIELSLLWEEIIEFYETLGKDANEVSINYKQYSLQILKRLIIIYIENKEIQKFQLQMKICIIFDNILNKKMIFFDEVKFIIYTLISLLSKFDSYLGQAQLIILKYSKQILNLRYTNESKINNLEIQVKIIDLLNKIFEKPQKFKQILTDNISELFEVFGILSRIKEKSIITTYFELIKLVYFMFWNQSQILDKYQKSVLEQITKFKEERDELFFKMEEIFIQNFYLENFTNLILFEQSINENQYQENLLQVFDFIIFVESKLKEENWVYIYNHIFLKIYDQLHKEYLLTLTQEIFVTVYNKTLELILYAYPQVDLFKRCYSYYMNIYKQSNFKITDCILMFLSQNIVILKGSTLSQDYQLEIQNQFIQFVIGLIKESSPEQLIKNSLWEIIDTTKGIIDLSQLKVYLFTNYEDVERKVYMSTKLSQLILQICKLIDLSFDNQREIEQQIDKTLSLTDFYMDGSVNRFILWNKGFQSQDEQIPNLTQLQLNLIKSKFFLLSKNIKFNEKIFLIFIENLMNRYIQLLKLVDTNFKNFLQMNQIEILKPSELNEEFITKNLMESQERLAYLAQFMNKQVHLFLNVMEIDYSIDYDPNSLLITSLEYIQMFNLNSLTVQKCLNCINCFDCGEMINGVIETQSIVSFIQNLIKWKKGQIIQLQQCFGKRMKKKMISYRKNIRNFKQVCKMNLLK